MGRPKGGSSDSSYPQLKPLRDHRNLAEEAYQSLYAAIYSRKIEPGEELNEVWLAQRLGVSATPVREALQRLAGDGLVVREPWHQPRVVQLTRREAEELYDVRGALEAFAAAEAAARVTDQDIERLRALQENGRRFAEKRRTERYDNYNDGLHQKIMQLAGNDLLWKMMQPVRVKVRLCMHTTTMLASQRMLGLAEHEEIIDRLAAHDAAGAAKAMQLHCERAKQDYLAILDKTETAAPGQEPVKRRRATTNRG